MVSWRWTSAITRLFRFRPNNDSEEVLRAIKLTDSKYPIELILHTPGGLVLAAGQIAHALKRHPARVTVYVPHYAMSGGTLIALAADEIVMDANVVLGPVDPQIGQSPAASVLTVLDRKKPEDIDDETFILADVSRKAIAQLRRTAQDLSASAWRRSGVAWAVPGYLKTETLDASTSPRRVRRTR